MVIFSWLGANAITLWSDIYFIFPGDCTWKPVLCRGRNKLSLLDQKQRQQPLNAAGPGLLSGEDRRQLPCCLFIPKMTFPAAACLLEVVEVRMLSTAPWGSGFPLTLLLSHSSTLGKSFASNVSLCPLWGLFRWQGMNSFSYSRLNSF